jgi:hypothetical protein
MLRTIKQGENTKVLFRYIATYLDPEEALVEHSTCHSSTPQLPLHYPQLPLSWASSTTPFYL